MNAKNVQAVAVQCSTAVLRSQSRGRNFLLRKVFFEVLKITENISMILLFLPFNPSFRLRRGSPLSFRVWRREKDRINWRECWRWWRRRLAKVVCVSHTDQGHITDSPGLLWVTAASLTPWFSCRPPSFCVRACAACLWVCLCFLCMRVKSLIEGCW